MQDGFELIKKKRRGKQKIKFGNSVAETVCKSQDTFNRKLKRALEEFESSQFCFEILQTVDNCLKIINLNCISEILCFGIGSILESKASLHQLAALVTFKNKYNSAVIIYDPVFTSCEIKTLEELKFKVLVDNEEGKRKVNQDQVSLVFFPHCPKQLTNNFLWSNWNISLCKCILITNSFSRIIQDNTEKVLKESANYILKIHPKIKEISLSDCYHIESVFNDIAIHYFRSQDLDQNFFSETLEREPVYLGDSELITKTHSIKDIKNE